MLKRLNPTLIRAAVINRIQEYTGKRCYDKVPNNAPIPFYAIPTVLQRPDDSKTMARDSFEIMIHAFSDGSSSIHIDEMTTAVYEAFSEYIELDGGYEVTLQQFDGVNQILAQEDGTDMAVMTLRITVFYGLKVKI
ncbi:MULTISPECIES: DUF5072 family protein [Neobacillus]|uniref:DUF5072 family protein n=1 Tax=Neobacillus TaxID=2675232 RepID=UPI0013CFB997|nr:MULTISPECIES: DUF5072 family protein [Neobacillus]MED3623261.1 DUF5072 family protein [Neobacillus thermocopriae]MED3714376.1 DUF5072 family protein [Neobacillus thermocopriae]